jgi:hypothetical protein
MTLSGSVKGKPQRKKKPPRSELCRDKLYNLQFLEAVLHLLHSILGSLEYRNPQVSSSVPGKHPVWVRNGTSSALGVTFAAPSVRAGKDKTLVIVELYSRLIFALAHLCTCEKVLFLSSMKIGGGLSASEEEHKRGLWPLLCSPHLLKHSCTLQSTFRVTHGSEKLLFITSKPSS